MNRRRRGCIAPRLRSRLFFCIQKKRLNRRLFFLLLFLVIEYVPAVVPAILRVRGLHNGIVSAFFANYAEAVPNGSKYGRPSRLYVVGSRGGAYGFPAPGSMPFARASFSACISSLNCLLSRDNKSTASSASFICSAVNSSSSGLSSTSANTRSA